MSKHTASPSVWREIAFNGIWKQNAGLVQILGLCPVLAISNTLVNAVSLGLATTLVTMLSGAMVASIRQHIAPDLRNPIFILIIASLVSCVDLLMNAYVHGLYLVLGIFIPLITTNCIVMGRAEAFASRHDTGAAAWDGLMMGLGLTMVLALLGGMREIIGKGTLFAGTDLLFGPIAKNWVIYIVPAQYDYQFLLALLPPGAFIGLGGLIAGKNWLDQRQKAQQTRLMTS